MSVVDVVLKRLKFKKISKCSFKNLKPQGLSSKKLLLFFKYQLDKAKYCTKLCFND